MPDHEDMPDREDAASNEVPEGDGDNQGPALGSGAFDLGSPAAESPPSLAEAIDGPAAPGAPTSDVPPTLHDGEILPSAFAAPARPGIPKSALIGIVVALAVAAGAVAIVKVAGPKPPSDIATVVPAEALGFLSISAEPGGEQRDALRSLMAKLPAQKRTEVLTSFDRALGSLLDAGQGFQSDVKPWLGPQLGFSAIAVGEQPFIVGTIGIRDEAAARRFLTKSVRTGQTFEIADNVAYLGETQAVISTFRASVAKAPLAKHPAYLKELASAGGQGLATLWLNGEQIGKQSAAFSGLFGGLTTIPGLDTSAGSAIFVLRAESDGLAFVGHQSGGPPSTTKPGRPVLLEGAPEALLGSLSLFDLKGSFAQLDGAQAAASPFGAYEGLLTLMGLDLHDDVLAWLGGEVSVIATPKLEFGLIADVTDEAAYERTMAVLVKRFSGYKVTKEGSGFTAVQDGRAITVRRASKRVSASVGVNATRSRALAERLITGGFDKLGQSAQYKALFGASGDDTVFQAYVNLASLAPFLAQSGGLSALEPFASAALRVTLTDGGSEFRLALKLA